MYYDAETPSLLVSPHELSQWDPEMTKTYIEYKEIKQESVLPRTEIIECLELRWCFIPLTSLDIHIPIPT